MKTIILSIIGILIILHICDMKDGKITQNVYTLLINSIKEIKYAVNKFPFEKFL